MGRAQPHELTARIREFEEGAESTLLQLQLRLHLGLGLGGTAEQEGNQERGGTDTYKHTGPLPKNLLGVARCAQLTATTIGWGPDVVTAEPLKEKVPAPGTP
jgi:hypothetical protein